MTVTTDDVEAFARAHLIPLALNILVALVIFIAGRMIAKVISRALGRVMERSRFDESVRKFLGDVVYAAMIVAVIIAALDRVASRRRPSSR